MDLCMYAYESELRKYTKGAYIKTLCDKFTVGIHMFL